MVNLIFEQMETLLKLLDCIHTQVLGAHYVPIIIWHLFPRWPKCRVYINFDVQLKSMILRHFFCVKLTRSCYGLQFSRWHLFPQSPECSVYYVQMYIVYVYRSSRCTYKDQSMMCRSSLQSDSEWQITFSYIATEQYSSRTGLRFSCHLIVRAEFFLSELRAEQFYC